jgi:phospholipid transport system substrate-binding protein
MSLHAVNLQLVSSGGRAYRLASFLSRVPRDRHGASGPGRRNGSAAELRHRAAGRLQNFLILFSHQGAERANPGGARPMTAPRNFCTALLFAAAFVFVQPAGAAGDANPAASTFMQKLGNEAIQEFTDRAVPKAEREARFRRLLNEHFDMAAISKFVLGRYWRSADEAQRTEFQKLFEDFIVGSYSARFSEYRVEAFKVAGSTTENGGTTIVHSKIDMPSSEDIRVDWRLRRTGSDFAIVDIIVEGVSMAVTQRSEFASVIQSRVGVHGLIEALRTKNAQSANTNTE